MPLNVTFVVTTMLDVVLGNIFCALGVVNAVVVVPAAIVMSKTPPEIANVLALLALVGVQQMVELLEKVALLLKSSLVPQPVA